MTHSDSMTSIAAPWFCETPEILEHIFKFLSVGNLKNCRLVNQIWNREACRSLRKSSCVSIIESEKDKTRDFFENINILKPNTSTTRRNYETTPSPFSHYKVYAEKLGKKFEKYLLNPVIQVAVVHLELRKSVKFQIVHKILQSNSNCLQILHLTIKGDRLVDFEVFLDTSINENEYSTSTSALQIQGNEESNRDNIFVPFTLPNLIEFGFQESDPLPKKTWTCHLVKIIKSAPQLTKLGGRSEDENVFLEIFQRTDLKQIQELKISSFTKRHLSTLVTLKLPKLKSLALRFNSSPLLQDPENEIRPESLQFLIRRCCETIEELDISWVSDTRDQHDPNREPAHHYGPLLHENENDITIIPFCPHLKTFTVTDWNGALDVFNEVKLPKLKHLYLINYVECLDDFGTNPHYGVEGFSFECSCDTMSNEPTGPVPVPVGQDIDEEHIAFFEYIQSQFPVLSSLELSMAISNELCTAIVRIFPNLERLVLDTKFSLGEHIFTGVNRLTLKRLLRRNNNTHGNLDLGRILDHNGLVPCPCIRNLTRLKELALASNKRPSGVYLTNNAIQFGIANMPALQSFRLNWNSELSVNVISATLSHLDELIVNNSDKFEPIGILISLKRRLPQTNLNPNSTISFST